MRSEARLAAAIEVLDRVLAGEAAEAALTRWGRAARYAGSGDRLAVRDHVFDALRRRRSYAALGGGETGRAMMIGALRHAGVDPALVFDGQGHAPQPLTAAEMAAAGSGDLSTAQRLDLPDWLYDRFVASLGTRAGPAAMALRDRAPVFLRVNLRKTERDAAIAALAAGGIDARAHADIKTAVEVTGNARKVQASPVYENGLVELQDAAPQAAVLRLPLRDGLRVLDYCAGGGGKALAIAALSDAEVVAHDAAVARMTDLAHRARRACVEIRQMSTRQLAGTAPFDLVIVDAPCSGSGTWRRTPDAKWRLTPAALARLCALQTEVLDAAQVMVRQGGHLSYMTCSLLSEENGAAIKDFLLRHPRFVLQDSHLWLPGPAGDGFYLATLRASS